MKSRHLNSSEIAILSAVCRSKEWLPLEVASVTGLRIGDVLKIKKKDLNYDDMCIDYTAEKTGKQGKAYISRSLMGRLQRNAGKGAEAYVFPSPTRKGKHLTRQTAWYRIKRACHRAGISPDGVSPHSLRKVFAVEIYKKYGIAEVKRQLQHSTIDVTEIYALSDFLSGENEDLPLLRKDIARVCRIVENFIRDKKRG